MTTEKTTARFEIMRKRFAMLANVPLENIDVDISIHDELAGGDEAIVRFLVKEYMIRVGENVYYPANWWEAFKEHFFPWMPIKRVKVERLLSFPQATKARIEKLAKKLNSRMENVIIEIDMPAERKRR